MNFDKDKYKVWQLPHPMVLHWVLNPGLAFNELILGQRLPKVMLVDKTSDAPLMERQYVPCPECNVLTDARVWGGSRSKGHWFGYVCPGCNGRIPCLWNLTSLVLLALTFPLGFGLRVGPRRNCWKEKNNAWHKLIWITYREPLKLHGSKWALPLVC